MVKLMESPLLEVLVLNEHERGEEIPEERTVVLHERVRVLVGAKLVPEPISRWLVVRFDAERASVFLSFESMSENCFSCRPPSPAEHALD